MFWRGTAAAARGILCVLRNITNLTTTRKAMRKISTESSTRSPVFDHNAIYRRTDESTRQGYQTRRIADDSRKISAIAQFLAVVHG